MFSIREGIWSENYFGQTAKICRSRDGEFSWQTVWQSLLISVNLAQSTLVQKLGLIPRTWPFLCDFQAIAVEEWNLNKINFLRWHVVNYDFLFLMTEFPRNWRVLQLIRPSTATQQRTPNIHVDNSFQPGQQTAALTHTTTSSFMWNFQWEVRSRYTEKYFQNKTVFSVSFFCHIR